MSINQTIDSIFSEFGVNATNLLRRAQNALERAETVK